MCFKAVSRYKVAIFVNFSYNISDVDKIRQNRTKGGTNVVFELKLRSCLLNLLGSAILAFGIYNIHSVSGITEGGVLGMTLLLEYWFSISPAISGLILNASCYILGAKNLGKNFIGYSLFAGGGFSLFYSICERFPPIYPEIANYPLAAALVGAVFIGTGAGIAVRAGGAPSGDDALAMSLSHIFKCNINIVYLISDLIVLGLSLSYIPLLTISYSLLTVVLSGSIIGIIQRIGKVKNISPSFSDNESRNVLVGTLRNTSQLEVCIKQRFYHIPAVRLRDSDFPIRYVAIYQSKHKFGNNAGIRYYGEVENCTLVPRSSIKEIPKTSETMYYRFDISEWKTLPHPIRVIGGDIISMTTTRFLLENSLEVPELFLESKQEFELYKKLRSIISGQSFLREIKYPAARICFSGGKICVIRKSRRYQTDRRGNRYD